MQTQRDSRTKFLDATLKLVRTKGYTATRIEDVCTEAGLTKGSFFHHFKSKDDLAHAAVSHWNGHAANAFADAPFFDEPDPADRLIAYVAFRKEILAGDIPDFTCFAGTIVQEAYRTHPRLAAACAASLEGEVEMLEADIGAAIAAHGPAGEWTPNSLALHIQAVIQGGFILAKAHGTGAVAAQSLDHLGRYLALLFGRTPAPSA